MHMQGDPRTMQEDPTYEDVVEEVRRSSPSGSRSRVAAGVAEERIWVDPGIGFGKTLEHNLELLRRLGELRDARPAVVDRHLAQELHRQDRRLARWTSGSGGTIASSVLAAADGADVFRVHDVAEVGEALQRRGGDPRPA